MERGGAIESKAQQVIIEELEILKSRIASNMVNAGEVASGRTLASLMVTSGQDGSVTLWGRKPFGVLETGRKGGRVPANFGAIIYQWMQDKGLHSVNVTPYKRNGFHKYSEQERADRSMAFAIAATIKKSGTRLYRKGGRTDIYSELIPETLKVVSEKLSAMIDVSVTEQIKLNVKNSSV